MEKMAYVASCQCIFFIKLKHNQNKCLYQLRLILLVYSNRESRVYYKSSLSEVALLLFRKCFLKVAYPCYSCLRRFVLIDSKIGQNEVTQINQSCKFPLNITIGKSNAFIPHVSHLCQSMRNT